MTMRVALVGNPNAGKTTLFNRLTRLHQHVANWPGTTVDYASGVLWHHGVSLHLTDLPGIYGLTAYADDERATRRFLLSEPSDVVVVVADASRLERSLFLVLDTLEFSSCVVVALNKMDIARANGVSVEVGTLAEDLGVPVVPIAAQRSEGLDELLEVVIAVGAGRLKPEPKRLTYQSELEERIAHVASQLSADMAVPGPARWTALRLLQGDSEVLERIPAYPERQATLGAAACRGAEASTLEGSVVVDASRYLSPPLSNDAEFALEFAEAKYAWVHDVMSKNVNRDSARRVDWNARLDTLALHPLLGPMSMVLVFGVVFWLSFQASAPVSDAIALGFSAAGTWLTGAVGSLALPTWIASLLVDGVLAGVGAVLSFVPYMAVFFACVALIESSGYMARAALVADRTMQAIGLHGRSLFPLVSAFGCNVPALAATRGVESRRDRMATCLVIPFIPCNARLGVMAVLAGAFFHGGAAGLVVLALVLISVAVVVVVSLLYRGTVLKADLTPLVLELPPYAVPRWQDVALPAFHHCIMFVRRIWRFLIPATVLIWALTYFPLGAGPEHSYAAWLGGGLAVIGQPLGFDWRLMIAILFGFVAKETTLGTLGVLYGMSNTQPLAGAIASTVPPLVGFAFLVVYMLYVPCLATIVQMRKELGSHRWVAAGVIVNIGAALMLGYLVERAGVLFGGGM